MDEKHNKEFYKSIGKVYCPYFKDYIHFTRVGFEHIKYKTKYKARNERDQYVRFKLLPVSVKVISLSHTLQGITSQKRFEERLIHNRKEIALLLVVYYEFIAIIDEKKIKVVIKEIDNRNKVFLSIILLFKEKTPLEESDGFIEHLATAECRDG